VDTFDVVVIGAGVVGLAVARELALRGREVLILEAQDSFGTETSTRNSEVIHAGIYYPKGSLKALLCVSGRELLYSFCEQHGVEHRVCGKLIVATSEAQLQELDRIRSAARDNGVQLELLSARELRRTELLLAGVAALSSARTGIVDSHGFMLSLLGQAQNHDAVLSCGSKVTRMVLQADGVAIGTNGEEPALVARTLINCAGLGATSVARSMEGFPQDRVPTAYYAKGQYFTLSGRSPFQRLIYPIPEPGGLGVHLTLDLAGRARFGPDVEWVKECDYSVDPDRAARFYPAIRAYWPGLPERALQPAYAGIRPKISGPNEPAADFRIDGPQTHGVAGVVNLFGIESPGLTASLAIARHVSELLSVDSLKSRSSQ